MGVTTQQQLINKLEGGAYGKGTCQVPTMERIHAICTSAEKAAKNPSFWTDALLKNFKIINTQMRVYLVRPPICPLRLCGV
jgi:hypothetical protein